jgi:ADP-ribose diphosphatase
MPKIFRSTAKARVLSSREVYRGPVFWVTSDEVIEPAGVRVRRDIVRHSGSVVILALDESGARPKILLERQYRHAAEQFLWELPAGRIDPDESELTAAKRELMEETGYTATRWKRVLKFFATPGFVAEPMSVYLARGLRHGKARPEKDEVIHVRFLPVNQAVNRVLKGTVRDAKTIASILWLNQTRIGSRTAQKARST